LLRTSPALAARFSAVIDFPGYTSGQLTAVLSVLAAEAGFSLSADARAKAAAVLAQAEAGHATGNARLAVRLLTQATASQADRITAASHPQDTAALGAICAEDVPGYLCPDDQTADDQRPGQCL
jgi:AAA lid domain